MSEAQQASTRAFTFGSLFAGVGGFDLGLEAAGMRCAFQVEWDARATAVLQRHWSDIPRWGDIGTVNGADLPPVDLIAFGSPCQDLSVAGRGAGLSGERSSLFFQATRIIREMLDATRNAFPRWAIWENVPGALLSNRGADFGVVLDDLGDAGALVLEWAVLDARDFGVPQRRRRVFLVACFDPRTAERCPDPLLPISPSGCGNPSAGRAAAGSDAAETAGGASADRDENGGPLAAGQPSLSSAAIAFGHTQGLDLQASEDVFPTMRAGGGGAAVMQPFSGGNRSGWTPAFGPLRAWSGDAGGGSETLIVSDDPHTRPDAAMVRRLMPVECERLMGWPDDHTRWTGDGIEQPDSVRYRQIGNGVASPVAAWVGRQIMRADESA